MTKHMKLIPPAALLAAVTLAATPAVAQEKYHGRGNPPAQQSGRAEQAHPRNEGPRQAEAPRPQGGAAPRAESRQETPRVQQPRPVETPRAETPRPMATPRVDTRRFDNRNSDNRSFDNRRFDDHRSDDHRNDVVGHAVPRPQVVVPRGNVYAPSYSPRVYAPRVYVPHYRPYVFRPHFSIGFGIYAGYPVPYTYSYPYPVPVYGYGAPRDVIINPGATAYGGVALDVTPSDADVWVDGQYAGKVQDFDGTTQPLTLTPGTHRIEVAAPGYQTMTVEVGIQAGQVVPYRGDLLPY
jgi:hypothetical protein